MKRKKRSTRKQKVQMDPHGSGNSKYAQKLRVRRKLAKRLGLSVNATYPEICAAQ